MRVRHRQHRDGAFDLLGSRTPGLPLVTRSATWGNYTQLFTDALEELADSDCASCVFVQPK
jgi:hypothetical protein